jgi:hypothetical protein
VFSFFRVAGIPDLGGRAGEFLENYFWACKSVKTNVIIMSGTLQQKTTNYIVVVVP